MALKPEEIASGVVAYFNHQVIIDDGEIDSNDDHLDRDGPFLCVEARGGRSVWVAITTQRREYRLRLERAWRTGGSVVWRQADQFMVDGLNTYLGPDVCFVRATDAEVLFQPGTRPGVTEAGVAAALEEIRAQGGPLLDD